MPKSKARTGTWFAVAVAVGLGLWFGGNELYTRLVILPRDLPLLQPGTVSLIGMKVPGYHIVVSNGVARLEIGEAGTFANPSNPGGSGGGLVIPIKGLIGALQFDAEKAVELVTALNSIRYDMEPLEDRIWKREDLLAALESPGALRNRLEYDLATRLDGKGVERVNWDRLTTGIWVEMPVDIVVPSQDGTRTITAIVRLAYKSRLASAAEANLQRYYERPFVNRELTPSPQTIEGVYTEALELAEQQGFEDVSTNLRRLVSGEHAAKLAEPVNKLLSEVAVLVTDETITDASLKDYPDGEGGKLYSLILEVTQDSRDRLWQYTYRLPGSQLLLVSNGVAIAAPAVQHQMKYSTVEIVGIAEQKLATEALGFIESSATRNP